MVDVAERIHPLQDRVYGSNGVSMKPAEACERIALRAEDKAVNALGKAIGVALPRKAGTSSIKGEVAVLWIGPDEWLVIAPDGTGLEEKMNKVKAGLYSVVSVNHRNTAIEVSGNKAVHALNSGCPRDLSLEAFPVGACSRTILSKAEIVLWRTGEEEFRVECWRSFSDYVWKHLVDGARSA